MLTSLIAYVAAATLLTVTPGLDTALVLRTAAGGTPRSAALAGLGIATGCFVWAALVALGLGALLAASQAAYTALRWIGAGYLLWVGYRMLRHPRRAFLAAEPGAAAHGRAFLTGLLTNLLNPKVGVFYVSFLPQFVPAHVAVGPYMLLLGAIHALLGLIWFACLIAATRPLSTFLRRPRVVRTCDRLTGGVFVAFSLGLALESRRR
ncbi:MAG TPA: LysE family translocator [Steroidobacteraceae bacterium]|nr:LysE family translocator [Steroidobacteraceae bacterium]